MVRPDSIRNVILNYGLISVGTCEVSNARSIRVMQGFHEGNMHFGVFH